MKLRPYPLEFVSYTAWKELEEKDKIIKNAKEVFYVLEPLHLEKRLAFICVQSALYTRLFHSLPAQSI